MFHTVEKYKTPAQILLGLIALTFVGFGVETARNSGSDYIVKVGSEKISDHTLNNAVQADQAAGGGQSREAIFSGLVQRAYLKEGAKMMGIDVSMDQVKQAIVDDPAFHDANGKFSQALFTQYLSQRRMSEDQFIDDLREQFALQNLINLVQNGAIISDSQAEQLIKLTQSNRTIRSFTFRPETFAAQVKTDDATLQRYYEAHKKDYLIPQAVKLEYVALNAAHLAEKQSVSADEVKKVFDEEVAALPQNAPKPEFDKEKARIEAALKLKKASADFNAAKEKLAEEAFNHPNSLDEAAKKLDLKIETSDQWLTQADAKAAGMPDALISAAFSEDVLKKKHNSDIINIDNNIVWVIRAKEVREEKTAGFTEARDKVQTAYIRSESVKLAEKKAQETLADLKAGKNVDLQWSPVEQLSAQDARKSMPPEAYNELIKARPANGKPAFALLEGLPSPVIMEVQSIAAPENVSAQIPAAKQALVQNQSANIFSRLLQYLSKQIEQVQGSQKLDNSAE